MFPRSGLRAKSGNCSLCVSRDVSQPAQKNAAIKEFALREQGCFSGRTKRTEKMLVRSA